MSKYNEEYASLKEDLLSGDINLSKMSDEDISSLSAKEFKLKWLSERETKEQAEIDAIEAKEAQELQIKTLSEEAKAAGYSGDANGTLDDWIKYFSFFKEDPAFFGIRPSDDVDKAVKERAESFFDRSDLRLIDMLGKVSINNR